MYSPSNMIKHIESREQSKVVDRVYCLLVLLLFLKDGVLQSLLLGKLIVTSSMSLNMTFTNTDQYFGHS